MDWFGFGLGFVAVVAVLLITDAWGRRDGIKLARKLDAGSRMNIDEAVAWACKEPTPVKALSAIAIWENDRAVSQAIRHRATGVSTASRGGGWDTCFEYCFQRVVDKWQSIG